MKSLFTFLFVCISFVLFAQNREKAFEINKKLGPGINYGNIFEAPSETAWGNPWRPEYAGIVAGIGFKHLRIPVRWEPAERSLGNPPYTIYPVFLNRIKQAVDSALNNGLYTIINMHHHEALYEDPAGQKERFLAQWKQISEVFKDYPDSLLFEVLNEPHGNLSAAQWNTFFADALTTIRKDNPNRIVLMGSGEYGGLGGLPTIQLPDDENIILSIHYYNPFPFTHQGAGWVDDSDKWLGTKWNDTETERQVIKNDFAPLKAFEQKHNIPIHIGEFGAYEKADITSRTKWTTYMARYIESQDWSWAYWEFNGGFGVYKHDNGTYKQELIDALLHNSMPEPATYVGTPVYSSNFPTTIAEWNLSSNSGAIASKQKQAGKLEIEIASKGTQTWHIQLSTSNIRLEAGKKYRLSFKAKAASDRTITAYVGESVTPWAAYSSYNKPNLSDTFAIYTYVFDMTKTDNQARIAFDMGLSASDVSFEYVRLESLVLHQPTSSIYLKNIKSKIYPNPVNEQLLIDNRDDFQELVVINMQGVVVKKQQLNNFKNASNLAGLPSGIYFVMLSNQKNRFTTKIIKS